MPHEELYKLRPIKKEESSFLHDMLYEAIFIPKGHSQLPRSIIQESSLSKYVEKWSKDEYDLAYVVEFRGELIGAIWGRRFEEQNAGFGFVNDKTPELSMAVKATYRNKGLGTKMLQMITQAYKNLGVKSISLSVDKANPAQYLYLRNGFRIIKETKTSFTMLKEIGLDY